MGGGSGHGISASVGGWAAEAHLEGPVNTGPQDNRSDLLGWLKGEGAGALGPCRAFGRKDKGWVGRVCTT